MNEFGTNMLFTGTDQIFIRDDYYDEDEDGNHAILVNGGWNIWFKPNEKVVRLGHYSDLVRVLEMVKMDNPDMEVGPNDSTTLINDHLENHPEDRIDLLAYLDIDFGKFKKMIQILRMIKRNQMMMKILNCRFNKFRGISPIRAKS